MHDKWIAEATPSPLPAGSRLLQDLGFLAFTLPQAHPVCDDATALDTAVDGLDPSSASVQGLVRQLLPQRTLLTTGCLGRHEDFHPL